VRHEGPQFEASGRPEDMDGAALLLPPAGDDQGLRLCRRPGPSRWAFMVGESGGA
jgi:hypothetical protein